MPPHQALRERVKAREKEAERNLPQDPRSRLGRHLGMRGFKIKDVPGDNNCQFHAIADQLEQVMAADYLCLPLMAMLEQVMA